MFTIPYVSSVTCQVSYIRCYMSGVTCQVSHVNCHVSHVMCHVSCVMYYVSHTIYIYSFYKMAELVVWGSVINRAYLSKFFFLLKCYDAQYLLILACSCLFWVIKKANWWEIDFRVIGLVFKCHKWQTSAAAESAPCEHFQKLDFGINIFFSNLGLNIFA